MVRDVVKYNVIGPIGKQLACGDIGLSDSDHQKRSLSFCPGIGAMTEWKDIVALAVEKLHLEEKKM